MTKHDLIVIGGGPGGYTGAIRAAQLGMNVACIDKNEALGGTCLRVGCIPSKALLESSHHYVQAKLHLGEFGVNVKGVDLDLAKMQKRKAQIVDMLTKGVAGLFTKHKITRYAGSGRFEKDGSVTVDGKDGKQQLEAKHVIIATG